MDTLKKNAIIRSICNPDQYDFIDWFHGTYETGKMTHVPTYQTEQPIITDDLDTLLASCPSLLQCRVSAIIQKEVNASTFFVGRLSDARFLFVQNDWRKNSSAIVIAPKCLTPMDAPFRSKNDDGDIACSLSAINNPEHRDLMTNGCFVYTLKRQLLSVSQVLQSIPFK